MNRDIDNSAVNMFCESISYNFRLFKTEILFERIITVVLSMAIILVGACSLAADANAPSSSDKSEQSDPFSEKGRKAGDRVVKVVDGMEFAFRWCPFGAGESEKDRDSSNLQSVSPQGFWIMETEVTVGMFRAFVKDTGYESHGDAPETIIDSSTSSSNGTFGIKEGLSWEKPGFEQNDRHPVTCVSWEDAVAFNKWLAGKLNKYVLLPTDEQWLCACKAGAEKADISQVEDFAWHWNNSNAATHPVGTKKPNAWGVFDMHGNAWEWCSDENFEIRVRRGGGYGTSSNVCSSALQQLNKKSFRCSDVGFRCIIEPDPIPIDLGIGKQAGERKTCTVKGVEFVFRWCPPGTFTMGSPESEKGRKNDEIQHQVTLTKGFWMMETEVTQAQWEAIMGNNPSWNRERKNPIAYISWNDSQLFCQKCTKLGLNMQLPTEAQWEYACRAGTTDAFAGDISDMGWVGYYYVFSNPVRMKMPNEWGLYDMHGNVCELCSDWYASYPRERVTDPKGPPSGSHHIMRGGCFRIEEILCRSANRGKCAPDFKSQYIGFRCVIGKGVSLVDIPKTSDDKTKPNVTRIAKFGQGVKAGERKTAIVNGVEFAFRWCPPGAFMMGSPESEDGHSGSEKQHKVTLTKGFWIMETEVSQEHWLSVMDINSLSSYSRRSYRGDKLPINWVSWNECHDFCQKCSEVGLAIQLPTEAQWEYACRAGTTGAYAGNIDEMAWHSDNSGNRPHPVGKKKPNAWGLYDMHGNVMEWCEDLYGDFSGESETDPTGSSNGSEHVGRGGSWGFGATGCRSASRLKDPSRWICGAGFRCVIIPND